MSAFSSLCEIARLLVTNKQGGLLVQMQVTPDQPVDDRILGSIVVHAVSVFSSNLESPEEQFLLPFINMLIKPEVLNVS